MTTLSKFFETRTRDNGESFVTLVDDAPEWLEDAIREAHQSDLPNDWIYEECRAVCEAVDCDELSPESVHEHADSRVDIDTSSLFQWAADMCGSSAFSEAEERAVELGAQQAGKPLWERLGVIQFCAIAFIAETMLAAIENARSAEE